jgi:glycosyltransferase involved in cell wall biosynthesis
MSITVIIPYAGQADQLSQAIRSVFAQTFDDWRLLLVSDGADAEALAVAHAVTDPRVALAGDERRMGLATRLNESIRLVDTPYVARMDGDDVMFPERLSRQVEALQPSGRGEMVDVVGSRAVMLDEDAAVVGLFKEPPLPDTPVGYLRSNAFTHPTVSGRTQWFLDHPYRDHLRRSQDKELWLRTNRGSSFLKLGDPLLFYRVNRRIRKALYGASSRADREILREYGPGLVGSAKTLQLLFRSRAKQSMVSALGGSVGFERWYTGRRFEVSPEQGAWQATLDAVLKTPVPGL